MIHHTDKENLQIPYNMYIDYLKVEINLVNESRAHIVAIIERFRYVVNGSANG